ncbi:hypothetical protein UY3_12436 [Chelonia mydas]|uniref:Uncharacterized protein n=1 Tax=Chelonia mydas TaxID=8469 RepID=M7B4J6_CHEMY|nr:hypothetical protein UY3_12436 [Chelonia mydas]
MSGIAFLSCNASWSTLVLMESELIVLPLKAIIMCAQLCGALLVWHRPTASLSDLTPVEVATSTTHKQKLCSEYLVQFLDNTSSSSLGFNKLSLTSDFITQVPLFGRQQRYAELIRLQCSGLGHRVEEGRRRRRIRPRDYKSVSTECENVNMSAVYELQLHPTSMGLPEISL